MTAAAALAPEALWVWVGRIVKAFTMAAVAAAVLAPLAAFFRPNDPSDPGPDRESPAVTRPPATSPPPSRVRPIVPPTLEPPTFEPPPVDPPPSTTVVPDPNPSAQRVCGFVQDEEAAAVLGGAVASRTPGQTSGFGRPMPACVISTVAADASGGAQLTVAVGNEIDYLLAQALEPTAINLGIGLDSYVAEHPGSAPLSVGLGMLEGSQCVVFQIAGSTAVGSGVVPATDLLVAVRSRL